MLYEIPLRNITIMDNSRIVGVTHPVTGVRKVHGLGCVGDPLLPFLDHRNEGYVLTLGKGPRAPQAWLLDTRGPRLANGKFPSRRVPFATLEVPDWSPWDTSDEGEGAK